MPPTGPGISNLPRGWQSLGVDPDGKLIFIDAGLYKDFPNAAVGSAVSYQLAVATRSVFCPEAGMTTAPASGKE